MTTTSDAQPDLTHPQPTARRRFRPWQWLIGLLLVAGGAGLVWYYDFGTPAARPGQFGGGGGGPGGPADRRRPRRGRRPDEKPPVRVVTAEKRNIGVALKALGTVTPINTVTVRSRLDGELVRVHFTEGQRVREGQLLAEIDARPYQVALAQAQGNKAENDARLNNARADLATYQSLFDRQLIPKQQLTAQESLVKQVEGTVQSNDAQVNNAKLQLSYTRIVAPDFGPARVAAGGRRQPRTLRRRQRHRGDHPDAADLGAVHRARDRPAGGARRHAPRSAAGTCRPGIAPRRPSSRRAPCRRVDNQIDTTTGTIRLRAVFDNADDKLFPNQFVNIVLSLSTLRDATVVPSATIQRASFGTFVYAITADSKATVRRVTLGPTEAERVAITEGLKPGDRVVLEGVDALREGITVEVVGAAVDRDAPVAPRRPRGQRRHGRQDRRHGAKAETQR